MAKYITRLGLAVTLLLMASLSIPAQADDNPVHLELGGEGAKTWNITNIYPGLSGTKVLTLTNVGSVDGFVTIWISQLTTNGELYKHLLFNISCSVPSRLEYNINLPTTIDKLPQVSDSSNYLRINQLNVGEAVSLEWHWELPAETGNEVEGSHFSFTMSYRLEEFGKGDEDEDEDEDGRPPPGTTDVSGMVSDTCRFLESLTIISEDGLCRLYIPEGTVGLTWELECVSEITIVIMDEPPPPPENAYIIGLVYDLSPDDATFHPPVSLTISYDPADIPQGVAEEDMVIAYYDEEAGEWVELECTVTPETNTITASISHFTAFAVLGYVPATFILGSVVISPTEVDAGETVNVSISVANTGGMASIQKVTLKINGVVEAIRYVIVAAGESETVAFSTSRDVTGSYSVDVNGLSGSFRIRGKPAPSITPAPTPTPTPTPTTIPEKPFNWPVVGGIIAAAVVAVAVVAFFLVRRERKKKSTLTT